MMTWYMAEERLKPLPRVIVSMLCPLSSCLLSTMLEVKNKREIAREREIERGFVLSFVNFQALNTSSLKDKNGTRKCSLWSEFLLLLLIFRGTFQKVMYMLDYSVKNHSFKLSSIRFLFIGVLQAHGKFQLVYFLAILLKQNLELVDSLMVKVIFVVFLFNSVPCKESFE